MRCRRKSILTLTITDEFLFYGEMIFPWMFDEISELRGMKEAANILAEKSDWPLLYDLEVLSRNTVPVACAVYADDMFVNVRVFAGDGGCRAEDEGLLHQRV